MKKHLKESPLYYWEEQSYMMIIPNDENKNLVEGALDRISTIKGLKITDTSYDIEGHITIKLTYEKEDYEVGLFVEGISVPDYYLNRNFLFTGEVAKKILAAKTALTIYMKFTENIKKSYQLELKLALALVPDLIGVLDESAEKMLPAKWVELTANSKVLPSSKDLFSIQAVTGKNSKVWLHTHGLCRCHMTELEILESDQENYQNHYNLLSIYAMYVLDKKPPVDPRTESAYIGELINGYPVVVTCRSWTEGIQEYKKLHLGGEKDREMGHNSMTSVVFLYKSEEDEKQGKLSKVSDYDNLWGDNPLFFFSDEETFRMKDLAIERFNYVLENYSKEGNTVLLKIGLPLKEKGKFEHIWFELLECKGERFKVKLTQEPYDIPDIHTGYEAWFTKKDVTDWLIYTPVAAINPSNAYLLDDIKKR